VFSGFKRTLAVSAIVLAGAFGVQWGSGIANAAPLPVLTHTVSESNCINVSHGTATLLNPLVTITGESNGNVPGRVQYKATVDPGTDGNAAWTLATPLTGLSLTTDLSGDGVLGAGTATVGVHHHVEVDAANHGVTATATCDITVHAFTSPPPVLQHQFLYGGHVVTVDNNDAQLGWKFGGGAQYACARTFGFGMTVNGSPHLGFTSATTGYWSGLAAGHTYDIELFPCNSMEQPTGPTGWINLVTTR
jgi:hypothetical protein